MRAIVVAGSRSIEYLAAGSGRPILVLATEPRRARMVNQFREQGRVICPMFERSCDGDGGFDWLSGFLDGLGVEKVLMVVDESCVPMAGAFPDEINQRCTDILTESG